MTYDATYHRAERLRALARWAEVGVLEQRTRLPIERAFANRIAQRSDSFFKPVAVHDVDSVTFHRELSYLVDALDSLPWRVDIAFDSTWKAFELETKEAFEGNVTDRLKLVAETAHPSVVERLCQSIPAQSCEYLFKRLVSDAVEGNVERGLKNRILNSADQPIQLLLNFLQLKYGSGPAASRRKGAMLLRRALRGETLELGEAEDFRLETTSRARVLLSLLLYTTRNERFHGSSFSPFVSSAATLSTYTHPYFAFLASYSLLLSLWLRTRPEVLPVGEDGLVDLIAANMTRAEDLFATHWDK